MNRRISAQARAVLAVLEKERCHLSAEEILSSVDGIGTATVYRALDTLTEAGLVRRLSLNRKSAVYEYVRGPHLHLVCRGCGGVFDIPADLSGLVDRAAECCGHLVDWTEITAYGCCKACAAQEAQS